MSARRAATRSRRCSGLLRESMRGGALGFSTNRNPQHMREDGKPVPSRLAEDDEVFALADVLGEHERGHRRDGRSVRSVHGCPWHGEIARRTGQPVCGRACSRAGPRAASGSSSLTAGQRVRQGRRTFALANSMPLLRYFNMADTQVLRRNAHLEEPDLPATEVRTPGMR